MIPSNPNIYDIDETTGKLLAPFIFPDNISTDSELEDYELGGVALQNPLQGLEVQTWKGYWNPDDSTAYLIATSTDPDNPIPIFTEPDVVEFCFTFDQNMRWAAAIRTSTNLMRFRWYDTLVAAYVTTEILGVRSVRLALDDKRTLSVQQGNADIIITTINEAGGVGWRIQRDRFELQYNYTGRTFPSRARITHFGMSQSRRLQWRIAMRRPT